MICEDIADEWGMTNTARSTPNGTNFAVCKNSDQHYSTSEYTSDNRSNFTTSKHTEFFLF